MENRLKGIFAPITTPFVEEEVSIEHLTKNMKKYARTGLNGFFALGSNGESKSLSESEKLKVLDVIIKEKSDDQVVMAGTGYESTRQTIEFSRKVEEAGADFISVLNPSYFKKRMTDEALTDFFCQVADASKIPVVAYNAPGFSGITLSPKLISDISQHPNIVALKDTSKGNMDSYITAKSDDFTVLSGTVSTLFSSMLIGATGGVVSLANAFPEICCDLYAQIIKGNIKRARELHFTMFKLNKAVSGSFGVAGVKCAMDLAGYFGGDPRLPLLPMPEAGKDLIRTAGTLAGVL